MAQKKKRIILVRKKEKREGRGGAGVGTRGKRTTYRGV